MTDIWQYPACQAINAPGFYFCAKCDAHRADRFSAPMAEMLDRARQVIEEYVASISDAKIFASADAGQKGDRSARHLLSRRRGPGGARCEDQPRASARQRDAVFTVQQGNLIMQAALDTFEPIRVLIQGLAALFACYCFYRWGMIAGQRETADHFAADIDRARKIIDGMKPKPDWRLDPETGQYLDSDGLFHSVPVSDADMITMIRARLGLEGNADLWAGFTLHLSTDAAHITQLENGITLVRSGLAKAAEVVPALVTELQTLRGVLTKVRAGLANANLDLASIEAMDAVLAPKDAAPDVVAMARLKELGIIGPGTAQQIYEKAREEGALKPGQTSGSPFPVEYVPPAEVARRAANAPDVLAEQQRQGIKTPSCPKCGATSGGDWGQCRNIGAIDKIRPACPILASPYFDQATADHYGQAMHAKPANEPAAITETARAELRKLIDKAVEGNE